MFLTSDEKGEKAEERFFKIFSTESPTTPQWFVRMKRVSSSLDVRGVDAIAFVHNIDGGKWIKVPIQIKSSRAGVSAYFLKHPKAWFAGVIVIIVNDRYSDDDIRSYVFGKLRIMHEKTIRFDTFFKEIFERKLSVKGHSFKETAGTRRMFDRPKE